MRKITELSPFDTDENGEGTLTKCNCGREFFMSFAQGFKCERCKKKSIKITDELIKEVEGKSNAKIPRKQKKRY